MKMLEDKYVNGRAEAVVLVAQMHFYLGHIADREVADT